VDGKCSHCDLHFRQWQVAELQLHLLHCRGLDDAAKAALRSERTAAVAELASQPANVTGRKAAAIIAASWQHSITEFADRVVSKQVRKRVQALQLRMHVLCNIPFNSAAYFAYINFFNELRPGFKPAGNWLVHVCVGLIHFRQHSKLQMTRRLGRTQSLQTC
jgi:hypothetical protein